MSKYCSNCGKEVSEGVTYCSNCGNAINGIKGLCKLKPTKTFFISALILGILGIIGISISVYHGVTYTFSGAALSVMEEYGDYSEIAQHTFIETLMGVLGWGGALILIIAFILMIIGFINKQHNRKGMCEK